MSIVKPRTMNENEAATPDDVEKSMPIGVGEFSGEDPAAFDPLAGAESGRRFNTGSLVLVGVIVIACGGLWLMRTVSSVRGNTGASTEFEQTVEKFLDAIKGDSAVDPRATSNLLANNDHGVLEVLKQTYTDRQVPLSDVQRNPFIMFDEMSGEVAPTEATDSSSRVSQRRAEFQKAADTLRLKSVIMGSQPLANISSKIVRVGDEFIVEPSNVAFRVSEITSDLVKLVAEDTALNLKVGIELPLKRDQLK